MDTKTATFVSMIGLTLGLSNAASAGCAPPQLAGTWEAAFSDGNSCRLKLQSKTKESDFGEIIVGLDASGLRFMQLHDQFEQVTDIVFSDVDTNKTLAKEIFEFIPPEGVDVFGG